jgi:DNA-directed RNA polymerase specialized sigma24 family protein
MSLYAADEADAEEVGLFEPRRLAFIESIADLRPRIHRYCARMTGSALDGEDVMQEAIFEAYLKLGSFDASRALAPGSSGSRTIAVSISCAGGRRSARSRRR